MFGTVHGSRRSPTTNWSRLLICTSPLPLIHSYPRAMKVTGSVGRSKCLFMKKKRFDQRLRKCKAVSHIGVGQSCRRYQRQAAQLSQQICSLFAYLVLMMRIIAVDNAVSGKPTCGLMYAQWCGGDAEVLGYRDIRKCQVRTNLIAILHPWDETEYNITSNRHKRRRDRSLYKNA